MSIITRIIKKRFDYKLLSNFIKQKNICLSQDYSNIKLNRDSIINGNCSACFIEVSKNFRAIIKQNNLLCKKCTNIHSNNKKINTFMKNYGVEHPLKSLEIKNKIKDTCMKKYGVENPFQFEIFKQKSKDTCMKNFGVEHSMQSNLVKEKSKDVCTKKYGFEYSSQSDEVKQKNRDTCKKKYGVEYSSQSDDVKQKSKDTCMKKYGVEHHMKLDEFKKKNKETCIKNFGVSNPSQSSKIQQKKIDTCIKKYGVKNHMQNPEIAEKCMLAGFDYKNYTLPSGKIIHYQGYENFGIRDLLNSGIDEKDIINDKINIPEIWYDYEGKRRRYYVDIFIPSQNKCIEIKSDYTLNIKKDKVLLKQKATKELGYKCEIWVYNKNGIIIECIV